MTIFAIGDLHLSDGDKPMDVFGAHWTGHMERIEADWRARVAPEDVVLLPGDLSWAMQLEDAAGHLARIGALPGRKLLVKGNHDYWWGAISRVRERLAPGTYAIQNDFVELSGVLFCGTRGWNVPGADAAPEDVRIYERELLRLDMTLSAARRRSCDMRIVCMMHFPPVTASRAETGFTSLLKKHRVDALVYGHLHGPALRGAVQGALDGVTYYCASCDGLGFKLLNIG